MRFRLDVASSGGNIWEVAPTRCLRPPPATGQSQRVQQLETYELFNAGPKLGPFSDPRIGDQESDVRLSAFSFAIPESSPESGPEIGDIVRTWAPDNGTLIAITGRSSTRARQYHSMLRVCGVFHTAEPESDCGLSPPPSRRQRSASAFQEVCSVFPLRC